MADTDEIQKTNEQKEDPRKAGLAKARAAKAAKRAAEQAAQPIDDGLVAMQQAQAQEPPKQQGIAPPEQTAAARTSIRPDGRREVLGRNGERLSRSHKLSQDQFEVPKSMIPDGWEYQWNTVTVVGNSDIARDQMQLMYNSGWRPVPGQRHAGVLVPADAKGDILRGGLRLEERPAELCQEAREEDLRLARQLISDRNESLKLSGMRKNLGDGFEMNERYRGTGGDIRMSIDRALDAPAPSHKLAEPGE